MKSRALLAPGLQGVEAVALGKGRRECLFSSKAGSPPSSSSSEPSENGPGFDRPPAGSPGARRARALRLPSIARCRRSEGLPRFGGGARTERTSSRRSGRSSASSAIQLAVYDRTFVKYRHPRRSRSARQAGVAWSLFQRRWSFSRLGSSWMTSGEVKQTSRSRSGRRSPWTRVSRLGGRAAG